jgi:hypothetical protein
MPGHDANRLNCNTPFHAQKTIKKNNAEHFRWQAAYQAGDQAVANTKTAGMAPDRIEAIRRDAIWRCLARR